MHALFFFADPDFCTFLKKRIAKACIVATAEREGVVTIYLACLQNT